jgi:membrane-associated phospholipid phosphatase
VWPLGRLVSVPRAFEEAAPPFGRSQLADALPIDALDTSEAGGAWPVWIAAAVAVGAVVALSSLVAVGVFTGLDQWSVDHLMPRQNGPDANPSLVGSLFPIFDPASERGHVVLGAVTYAVVWIASVVPSVLLIGAALLFLWRRGATGLATALGVAFVVANFVEVIGKESLTRPALFAHRGFGPEHVRPFDSSFPSGHELRAVFIAVCAVACFRRPWLWGPWLVAVSVLLVGDGWHTPTDVAGGFLVAGAACLAAYGLAYPKRT